jgi:hypothetical protein
MLVGDFRLWTQIGASAGPKILLLRSQGGRGGHPVSVAGLTCLVLVVYLVNHVEGFYNNAHSSPQFLQLACQPNSKCVVSCNYVLLFLRQEQRKVLELVEDTMQQDESVGAYISLVGQLFHLIE